VSSLDPIPVVSRFMRRRRIALLIDELTLWEAQGRDLLAQVIELTDPNDDLHVECARVLDLLTDR